MREERTNGWARQWRGGWHRTKKIGAPSCRTGNRYVSSDESSTSTCSDIRLTVYAQCRVFSVRQPGDNPPKVLILRVLSPIGPSTLYPNCFYSIPVRTFDIFCAVRLWEGILRFFVGGKIFCRGERKKKNEAEKFCQWESKHIKTGLVNWSKRLTQKTIFFRITPPPHPWYDTVVELR